MAFGIVAAQVKQIENIGNSNKKSKNERMKKNDGIHKNIPMVSHTYICHQKPNQRLTF